MDNRYQFIIIPIFFLTRYIHVSILVQFCLIPVIRSCTLWADQQQYQISNYYDNKDQTTIIETVYGCCLKMPWVEFENKTVCCIPISNCLSLCSESSLDLQNK